MDKVKDSLESHLEAMRGPAMPADVEVRIRQRLLAEAQERPDTPSPGRRQRIGYAQWVVLAMLLLTAVWAVRQSVLPTLRAAWERTHCLPDSEGKTGVRVLGR